MAEKGNGDSSDTAQAVLKSLTAMIFNDYKDEPDVANRVYRSAKGFLLQSNNTTDEKRSLDDNEFFLKHHRRIKQYLEVVSPNNVELFNELTNKILFDADVLLGVRQASLRFLMHMGRKVNSDERILEKTSSRTISPQSVRNKKEKVKSDESDGADKSKASSSSCSIKSSRHSSDSTMPHTSSNTLVNNSKDVSPKPLRSPGAPSIVIAKPSTPDVFPCTGLVKDPAGLSLSPRIMIATQSLIELYPGTDVGIGLKEKDLIEGLLFVWQGIPGKLFQRDETTNLYTIHERWGVYPWIREQVNNMACLGYLHDKLVPFSQFHSEGGLVRQCLSDFVRDQLTDYYCLVASLKTKLQNDTNTNDWRTRVTLEELRVQSLPLIQTLSDMASMLEFTSKDHGGYIASGIYCFIHHGDPDLQTLVKKFLAEICQPLYIMLTKWVLEGNLCDPHREFFIAVANHVKNDRLWTDKYSIRIPMLPEFIPPHLAEKVLSVGRSLNFLRETCQDGQPCDERQKIKNLFQSHSAEVMYLMERREELEELIEEAYEKTNKRVLEVLLSKYEMMEHFKAQRKFLLLGQGDFVHHLMDLLMQVLNQPADQLHPHILNGILDSAVRSTTAQYEKEDILNRLDASTLTGASGDIGWDVFYLRYRVDGPIGTVFSLSSEQYQGLFFALWRAKRIEMILSKSWKHQITSAKQLRRIGELAPILKQCLELTAEMVHFVRQMQYYFLFEVLECAWNQLVEAINEAKTLDSVIAAHHAFLVKVSKGVFRSEGPEQQKLSTQLRMIYDLVLQLIEQVNKILEHGEKEARERSQGTISKSKTDTGKTEFIKRRRDFVNKLLPAATSNLKVLGLTYRDTIKKLLLMLNSEDDLNLQLLSIRLDFNGFYKNLDSSLEAPLTFQHRRFSSVGGGDISPLLARKFSAHSLKKWPNHEEQMVEHK